MKKVTQLTSVLILGILIGSYFTYFFYYRNSFCPERIVTLFDRNYFGQVDRLIKNANESIEIAMFELKFYPNYPNSLENKLVNDLIDASKRGVEVHVIADEYSKGENSTINMLKSEGIDAKLDPKKVTTHVKLLIIDGKIVVIGSTNWSYYALEKNHEVSVIIYSKEVAKRFEEYFWKLWRE